MFFRNLTMFRFAHNIKPEELEKALGGSPLRDPGPMELETSGFVSVGDDDQLVRWCGNAALFCLGFRTRLLPAAVVHEEMAKRIGAIAEQQGRRVGGKERQQIKEDVISKLLPQAFVKPARLYAYIDVATGWLVIDTASAKRAEEVVDALRASMGRFPCTPLTPEESPRSILTDWVIRDSLPADLALGDECELRDPAEAGAVVRCRRQDLESDEVREHVKSGKQVFALGLKYADRISFVLGDNLVVRRLSFLDAAIDDLDDDPESADAERDARFALMRLELERLFAILCKTFRIERDARLRLDGGAPAPEMREPIRNTHYEQIGREFKREAAKHGLNVSVSFRVGDGLTEELNRLTDLSDAERKWLGSGERGGSSEAIFAKLHGGIEMPIGDSHPLDPADFRRCLLLLETVPAFASRFCDGAMRDVSPEWARLSAAWDELKETFESECPSWRTGNGKALGTYALMKRVIDGVNDA